MLLEKMSWLQAKEAFEKDPVVIIPIGSLEQHGPQSALGTDFLVPEYLAEKVSSMDNVIVAPTVSYGVCDYHMSFPGTVSIGVDGLSLILSRIALGLMSHGARRFIVLNGHGGNTPAIDGAALAVYKNGGIMAELDWWVVVGQLDPKFAGGHGDKIETEAMLAVDESAVHLELCKDMDPKPLTEEITPVHIQSFRYKGGTVRIARDTKESAPSGWFGPWDPRDAKKEDGIAMMELMESYIRDFIEEFSKAPL
jgi:creatinine amidohydrolase